MSYQYPATQERVLYQADPNVVTTLMSIRDRVYRISSTLVNRRVRVQTLDGNTYEGVIVHVDRGHVYIRVSHPSGQRAFSSEAAILTLVLFELLVIVLLA